MDNTNMFLYKKSNEEELLIYDICGNAWKIRKSIVSICSS